MKKLLILLFFSGCITHQKLAEKCLEKYPPLVEVLHDTLLLVDTIKVSYEHLDTFYLDTTIVIKEIQKVESTAKLEVERKKFKKDFKRLYDQDLETILELNRILDKVANDTTKAYKEIRRLKEDNQKLKQRLSTANNYKWGVWIFAVVLFFIAFLKWFKPRLF
ncbi:hypothetical protein UFOVP316_41 [uncultured Caudovirales phage]|uniref:Uncharacterized protein n=1 Tax=uncultured Caudovirales phage TaxID=2100421 RepID=A0A6J5LSK1_9CAUD|nr:hypothetical protein UFOVP316_41 [uncultured Caudovirales phage]